MSNWKESARKSLENRAGSTPAPVVPAEASAAPKAKTVPKVKLGNSSNSSNWKESARKSLENLERLERVNSNPTFKRYNIDPDNFTYDDFTDWAKKHGFEYAPSGNELAGIEYEWRAPWSGKQPTKEAKSDLKVLKALADNNNRKAASQKNNGTGSAAVVGAVDGLTFGVTSAYAEFDTKKEYEKAGLDPEKYVSTKQEFEKTKNDNKAAYTIGNIAGSMASTGVISGAAKALIRGIPVLAGLPEWVSNAIASGLTFSFTDGVSTAAEGGDAGDVAKSAGIGFVGGAVGSEFASAVGKAGNEILFNKGWQHKVIPEMIRNGFTSSAFAAGKTLSTYFLYPEDSRPSDEQIATDLCVAFAIGSISSAFDTIKATKENKKYLDELNKAMADDYEKMARAYVSDPGNETQLRTLAENVINYSDTMEAYLTGRSADITINGKTYKFKPNQVRLVGQEKYVKSTVDELQTIRNAANAYLSGNGFAGTGSKAVPGAAAGSVSAAQGASGGAAQTSPATTDGGADTGAAASAAANAAAAAFKNGSGQNINTVPSDTAAQGSVSAKAPDASEAAPQQIQKAGNADGAAESAEDVKANGGDSAQGADKLPQTASDAPLVSEPEADGKRIVRGGEGVKTAADAPVIQETRADGTEVSGEGAGIDKTGENTDIDAAGGGLPQALRRGGDGKLRFNQLDIDYSDSTLRKGKFNTYIRSRDSAGVITDRAETVNGYISGSYGIYRQKTDGNYAVVNLSAGASLGAFKTPAEAKKFAEYLNEHLKPCGAAYVKRLSGGFVLERSPELEAYAQAARAILASKEYARPVKAEIKDGKVPFDTNAGLIEYVGTHKGDRVRVSYNNGASELRTLDSITGAGGAAKLYTRDADGNMVSAGIRGAKFNGTGFTVDYDTGVSVTFDFVNVPAEESAGEIKKDDVSFKSKSKAANDSSLGETSSTDSIAQHGENVNTSADILPKGQVIEDYAGAVDGIMTVSDDEARTLAENRTVIEVLKNTPRVILDNVDTAKDLKVVINFTKLYLAARKDGVIHGNYHALGTELTKKLPEFLTAPDAIIELENGRLNLFTSVKTQKGDYGIVSVELNSAKDVGGKTEDYNVVVTMFDSGDKYVRKLISKPGTVLKYKREDLPQVNPQLHEWLATINGKSSTDNSIAQHGGNVNTSENISGHGSESTTPGGMYAALDKLGLTYDEQRAILEYKSSGSYTVNMAMRSGEALSDDQSKLIKDVISALDKFPIYDGRVYRNIGFDYKEDFDAFIAENQGKSVEKYTAFTSTAKTPDSYPVDFPYTVHYEINGKSGRDVSEIGIKEENEVLFKPGAEMQINTFDIDGNTINIKCEELINNGKKLQGTVREAGNESAGVKDARSPGDLAAGDEGTQAVGSVRKGSGDVLRLPDKEPSSRREDVNKHDADDSVELREVDRNVNDAPGVVQHVAVKDGAEEIKENTDKDGAKDVHDGILDGQGADDVRRIQSEGIPEAEARGNARRDGGENGADVAVDDGAAVPSRQGDAPAAESVAGGVDHDRVGESDAGTRNDRGNADGVDNGEKGVADASGGRSQAKNYSMSKETAEYIDRTAPKEADNLEAIRVLHELENSGGKPTKAQLEILARYKGWGGLAGAFSSYNISRLKAVMTDAELTAARATVNDAYYTPTYIIDAIYKSLSRLGFEGGNVLEPSMGIGNFFAKMPKKLMGDSKLYGVEIDSISGRIASMLYPDAQIEIRGFQDAAYRDGAFDLVIGNVPFGDVRYTYGGKKYLIHDFFFRKSLDKLKDGGVMVFITSKGTLDKSDYSLRAELASKADLVAAYRLPQAVFDKSAGASVATDIIILQKKAGGSTNGIAFKNLGELNGIAVNEYFASHPENIIGELTLTRNQYGNIVSGVRATGNISEMLAKAMSKLPRGLLSDTAVTGSVDVADYTGSLQKYSENGQSVEYVDSLTGSVKTISGKKAAVAKDYIKLRDAYNALVSSSLSGESDGEIAKARLAMKQAYGGFVQKHGNLAKHAGTLSEDSDFVKVSGLEIYDTKKKAYIASEILEKDTLTRRAPTHADNAFDALGISLGERGAVDTGLIAQLTGKSEDEVIRELDDRIILTPDGDYELNEVYLSGNIREKLRAVEGKKGFEKNARMLREVMPEDIKAKDITPQFGAPWIPAQYVSDFLKETFELNRAVQVNYDPTTGTWSFDTSAWGNQTLLTTKYGTNRISAMELAEKAINMRAISVRDRDGRTLIGETRAAQQKADDIRNAFEEWCFKDSARRQALVALFNEKFNSHRNMDFSKLSAYLTFAGMSDTFTPRDYQRRAVARVVYGGNTLLAHGVGTGKTSEMIASAMELKRLGVVKKNLMTVPNHKVADFRNDILKTYPSAKVIALEKGANAAARQKFFARVASGDWDIAIVPHSSFALLDLSEETKQAFVRNQIDELEAVLTSAQAEKGRRLDGRFVRQLENQKKKLEARLEAVTGAAKDKGMVFEELGVDSLFVDEAHNFKSLPFYTKLARVAGVAASESSRAENMFMITDYINRMGGRVNFATATPITNSMSEIYNMIRFLRPDVLKDAGIGSFDAWASMFGSIVNEAEIDPTGRKLRMKERFSKFKNVSRMVEQLRRVMDYLKTGDVIKELPKAQRIDVFNESNPIQEEFLDLLDDMVAKIQSGGQRDSTLNMLTVTKAGQMAAIDLRMVHRFFEGKYSKEELDLPGNRTSKAAERIYKEYVDSNDIKGTQFVFCDYGVRDNPEARYDFNVYADLINKLTAAGIPRSEIAVAQEFDDKAELSAKVNTGEIRVLIGSTQVMGEGMNAQERAVALHHLTVPDRPSDIEQREGRIIRFGNINKDVRIYRYIQKRSYDSYQWQMQERKAKFINQALSEGSVSELEEMSDFVLTAREAKAIASGNPLLLEKMEVEDKLSKVRTARTRFLSDKRDMEERLATLPNTVAALNAEAAKIKADAAAVAAHKSDKFAVTLAGKVFDERNAAAEKLDQMLAKIPKNGNFIKLGNYLGLDLFYSSSVEHGRVFALKGEGRYTFDAGDSALGNLTRISNRALRLGEDAANREAAIKGYESEIKTLKAEVRASFPQEAELAELQAKLNDLNSKIGGDNSDDLSAVIAEDAGDTERAPGGRIRSDKALPGVSSYEDYTYDALVRKDDMPVTMLDFEAVRTEDGKLNRAAVIEKGLENVRAQNNPRNTGANAFVYIPDIDRNVLVGKKGLAHSLSRNAEATALVTTKIGDILKNSIRINELYPRYDTSGGYVLLGIAADKNKNYYPVRTVVNKYSSVEGVEVLDVLYAVKAQKRKDQSSNETKLPAEAVPPIKDPSVISIADLLGIVKDNFSEVLSDDVLNALGVGRGKSPLADSVRFDRRNTDSAEAAAGTSGDGIANGNIKYLDKIKSQEWSTSRGLQLPKLVQSIPDNNIVLHKENVVNTYYTKKSEKYSVAESGGRWTAERAENGLKGDVSISDIVRSISDKFKIPIAAGKVNDREAAAIYKETPEVIRTRIANNLPSISHELGHHLDKRYRLSKLPSVVELRKTVSSEFLDQYPEEAKDGEAVAEFVRVYLKGISEAERLCPEFYRDFVIAIPDSGLKPLNEIAAAVNKYLSYDAAKRYDAAIVSSKRKRRASFSEWRDKIYTDWVDGYHPLKEAVDYVEKTTASSLSGGRNAYMLATNSRNALAVANYLVCEGFRDLDGNIVNAKSFIDCISMVNSKDVKLLDRYLVLKHSLEWIAPEENGVQPKRVFADDTLENVETIEREIAALENEHPEIAEAADNLYEYQDNILKYFVIPAGGMTEKAAAELKRKYPCYVPFYRALSEKGENGKAAKSTFANQQTPIMRAKGSGAEIISPLESIIRNTEKMVKFSLRNRVTQVLADYADTVDGFGRYLEKAAPDMLVHRTDITGLKAEFSDALKQIVSNGGDYFAVTGLLDEVFANSVEDYTPVANPAKKIISVMRGGKSEYYQVHDAALYKAVAELSPVQFSGIDNLARKVANCMNLLVTQFSGPFALSNPLKDFGTAYKLSPISNPLKFAALYCGAVKDMISKSADFKQYKAMGGGHSSRLTAETEKISRTLRKVAAKDMGAARRFAYALFCHPLDMVADIQDAVETVPRFMEFKRTLKSERDLQKAIYNADDITTNFRRIGQSIDAKRANIWFRFNNASVQGLDKVCRTFASGSAKDRLRYVIKWLLFALAMGAVGYFYNTKTDSEGYRNLSSYKKNNFYNFAIGDGRFISLPKPRECGALDSFTERTLEYVFDGNEDAYYDFGGYLSSLLLPPMIPDTLDPREAVHSVGGSTIFGGLLDIGYNEDFKGAPIENVWAKQTTPSNERYDENTSWFAYRLGQTRPAVEAEVSPKQIDHVLAAYLGYPYSAVKAVLPVNSTRRDFTLGLRNRFISDSNYSTDVLNKVSENAEKAQKAFEYEGTVGAALEYEKNAVAADFISKMLGAIRELPEDEQRDGRAYLLRAVNNWKYDYTEVQSDMLDKLGDYSNISKDCIITKMPDSALEWTSDGVKYIYQMTPQEYAKYALSYLTLVDNARKVYGGDTPESYQAAKAKASEFMSKYRKILKAEFQSKAVVKDGR